MVQGVPEVLNYTAALAECRGGRPRPAHNSLTAALKALSAPVVSRTDALRIVPRTGLSLQSETRLHNRPATSYSLVQVGSRPTGQGSVGYNEEVVLLCQL